MKNIFKIIVLVFVTSTMLAQQDEELEVKGNVLFKDQVNSMNPPVPILNVPQTVTIITDEDILDQGFRAIADIVRYVPGVVTTQGEGHRDALVIRGVRTTADFYQDGMRDDVQYYRSLYNVDQVEVLKGPNALLFGRGGTGGLMNRVSKKALLGETFTGLNVGLDSFGAGDYAIDGNLEVNDSVAFRLNAHSDSLANHRDQYDGQRFGINPTMTFAVDAATIIDLSFEYLDHERFIDRGIPTANGAPVDALNGITYGTDGNIHTTEASILRGSLVHNYSDSGKINLTLAANDFNKMYQNLYVNGFDGTNVELKGYNDVTLRETTTISFSNVNEFDRGTLTVGLDILDTENQNTRFNSYFDNQNSASSGVANSFVATNTSFQIDKDGNRTALDYTSDIKTKADTDLEVTSLYLSGNIDLSDQWIMVLGARYEQVDTSIKKYTVASGRSAQTTGSATTSRDDSNVSPRLGVIYKPQDNMSLYLSYSESFIPKSGEQYKSWGSNAVFDPDVYENTELGFKYDMESGISFAISYFDQQTLKGQEDGVGGSEVIGMEIDGFEIGIAGQINEQNSINFGLTSVDATASAGTGKVKEVPELTWSLWYTHQANDLFGLSFGAIYQDEQIIKSEDGPLLPDFTRIDMAMTITPTETDTVRINIENLGNETYYPHSHSTHQVSVGEFQNVRISYQKVFNNF
ncbi:MAG: TonB-dependent siderophore receptor [Gammaproteobacteria bacterium]|nr:TonB-dependent siderophore receptor [Gammaproteobacteria bacterium]|tara:strand:+ start:1302 stop:3374 length:2073 start_codon:yes stop_codon:yes gene_type:complete